MLSHAFTPKFSIITNAVNHRNKRFVFNLDLENFFGTINFGRVRGFFIENRNFQLHPDVATVLAQIACHENMLPQGSPSSPVISNLIGHILDIRLAELAHKTGCTYSRYADDLTFSTNKANFPSRVAQLINQTTHEWNTGKELERLILKAGFTINSSKTRMQYESNRQEVTGLIVNKKINTRTEYRHLVRAMAHNLYKTGQFYKTETVRDATGALVHTKVDGTVSQLNGMLSFVDSVGVYNLEKNEPKEFSVTKHKDAKPEAKLSAIETVYRRVLFFKNFYSPEYPVILCEGKTDSVYIKAALRKLVDDFPNLAVKKNGKVESKIRFFNYTKTADRIMNLNGGTGQINKFIVDYAPNCKKISAKGQLMPVIVLIDNDEGAKGIYSTVSKVTKKEVKNTDDFFFVAENLYIVATPLLEGKQSTIEDFFEPYVRDTKLHGKSFSGKNTFDPHTQYGKHYFAEYVVKKDESKISFEGFRPILARLDAALSDYKKKT